ncbi:MAG TPA: hypothetical protein VHX65_10540 [Pirellulales bacterium]|jgi:hypothetical protein|nr:hypothetical protein [Pirellulales bacterium]
MRQTGLGALIGAILVLSAGWLVMSHNQASAQLNGLPEQGGELITLTSAAPENRQQVTVIDPRSRRMAVYHVDSATGIVSLKSVRNIQFDLMISEFNGVSPLPREIQSMLQNH